MMTTMKHHIRRQLNAFPYFKVATHDPRSFCFRDGKRAYPTEEAAHRAAVAAGPGRYRISRVDEHGRTDLQPFDVIDITTAAR